MMTEEMSREVARKNLGWFPVDGIMFVRCSKCKAEIEVVPVYTFDDENGAISNGLCLPCFNFHEAEVKAYLRAGSWEELP